MFNFFKKNKDYNKDYHDIKKTTVDNPKTENNKVSKKENKISNLRSFVGARFSKNNNFNVTFNKINGELRQDYIALILRARALAKNSTVVASYLNLFIKNVIGTGFHLNVTAYNEDGTSDVVANNII